MFNKCNKRDICKKKNYRSVFQMDRSGFIPRLIPPLSLCRRRSLFTLVYVFYSLFYPLASTHFEKKTYIYYLQELWDHWAPINIHHSIRHIIHLIRCTDWSRPKVMKIIWGEWNIINNDFSCVFEFYVHIFDMNFWHWTHQLSCYETCSGKHSSKHNSI